MNQRTYIDEVHEIIERECCAEEREDAIEFVMKLLQVSRGKSSAMSEPLG